MGFIIMSKSRLRHVTVLVVDDDPDFLNLQKKILGRLGVRHVINATSAADAFGHLNHDEGFINVILLDLDMPEKDGISFLKKLRKNGNERIASLPVIVVSAEEMDDFEEDLNDLDIAGFVHKPVVPELLEAEIFHAVKSLLV